MIALLLGLAWADPCAREAVVGRGLEVSPPTLTSVLASLDLDLYLRKRRIDGIPVWSVRRAVVDWTWTVTAGEDVVVRSSVGDGDALCEPEQSVAAFTAPVPMGKKELAWRRVVRPLDACRVRVVLERTMPALPAVTLDVHGPPPPGPDAPVDGPLEPSPGSDLVIDIPGCM